MRSMRLTAGFVGAIAAIAIAGSGIPSNSAQARTAEEIETKVDKAYDHLYKEAPEAKTLISQAKGILVVPDVVEGGFFIGAEYGEGALQVNGETTGYYSLTSASFGFQFGGQKKDVFLLFMEQAALENFRASKNWKAGIDASVAIVKVGAGGSIDTAKVNEPVVGFIVGRAGLMGGVSLEGSKITELDR